MPQTISKNKYVEITYQVNNTLGEVIERIDLPIAYIRVHGTDNQVIPLIETALEGASSGDTVALTLSPKEAFGESHPELLFVDDLVNVPEEFRYIGAEAEFQNDKGEVKKFKVTKITEDKLTLDGNHPLAGQTISYTITVKQVRGASPEELVGSVSSRPTLH